MTLQFYEWTCYTETVKVLAGAADTRIGLEHIGFPESDRTEVRGGAYMADPPDDFSSSRLG
jgi:hypothetical protein